MKNILIAVSLAALISSSILTACSDSKPRRQPKYQSGQIVRTVIGNAEAQVIQNIWCSDNSCPYEVRTSPKESVIMEEFELF